MVGLQYRPPEAWSSKVLSRLDEAEVERGFTAVFERAVEWLEE